MTSLLPCVRTDSRIPQFPNIYPASHHCLIMQTIHDIQHISTTSRIKKVGVDFFFLTPKQPRIKLLNKVSW